MLVFSLPMTTCLQTNPKAKFAVDPDQAGVSAYPGPPSPHSPVTTSATLQRETPTIRFTPNSAAGNNRSTNNYSSSAAKEPSSFDKEEGDVQSQSEDIDHLLDMLASPNPNATPSHSHNTALGNSADRRSRSPAKENENYNSSATTIFSKPATERFGPGRDSNSLPSTVVNQRLNFSSAASANTSGSYANGSSSSSGTTMFPAASTSSRINATISNSQPSQQASSTFSSSSSALPSTAGGNKK
jgi:hypothetical protein